MLQFQMVNEETLNVTKAELICTELGNTSFSFQISILKSTKEKFFLRMPNFDRFTEWNYFELVLLNLYIVAIM